MNALRVITQYTFVNPTGYLPKFLGNFWPSMLMDQELFIEHNISGTLKRRFTAEWNLQQHLDSTAHGFL